MSLLKKLFYISLILSITIFQACDRLNMYDIASGKSRTAYAIAYDGINYTLILANIYYDKKFISNTAMPSYTFGYYGMAVNDKKEILVYNTLNTAAIALPDLNQWLAIPDNIDDYHPPYPQTTNVCGYNNNNFVYYYNLNVYFFDTNNYDFKSSYPFYQLTGDHNLIFKDNNGQVYGYELYNTSLHISLYNLNQYAKNLIADYVIADYGYTTLQGTLTKGYKTKNAFYLFNKSDKESICKITNSSLTIINDENPIGTYFDAAVTDNDNIY